MQQSDFEQCQDFINNNLSFIKSKEDCCKMGFAFQKLNPSCLILLSQLIAIDLSCCLPTNQQDVVGNFLMAIGQSMALFNVQQAYMESGPGNCYNLKNLNSSNPDCTSDTSSTSNNTDNNASTSKSKSTLRSTSLSNQTTNSNNYQEQIDDLKDDIRFLKRWIDED